MQASHLPETNGAETETEELLSNSEIRLCSVSYSVPQIWEPKKEKLFSITDKLQKDQKVTDLCSGQNIQSWHLL